MPLTCKQLKMYGCVDSTVAADALVLKHQGISSSSAVSYLSNFKVIRTLKTHIPCLRDFDVIDSYRKMFYGSVNRGPVHAAQKWMVWWLAKVNEIIHVAWEYDIDGLVQDCSNSSVLVVELLQSCTKPLICLFWKSMIHTSLSGNITTFMNKTWLLENFLWTSFMGIHEHHHLIWVQ